MTRARLRFSLIVVGFVGLVALAGCEKEHEPASQLRTIKMTLGSGEFTIEVADNDRDRKYGLMNRKSMRADHGMLFVFGDEQERGFWMRNTLIPLDIVYVNAAGRVVSVKQMKPLDQMNVPSDGPAQYAIELNKGVAEEAGIKVGMDVKVPGDIKARD